METMPMRLFKIALSSCQFTIRTMPKLFFHINSYYVIFVKTQNPAFLNENFVLKTRRFVLWKQCPCICLKFPSQAVNSLLEQCPSFSMI